MAGRPELLWPIVLVGFIGTFGFNFPVWLSAYADDVFHADAGSYSLFNTLMAVGSVAGALLAASDEAAYDLTATDLAEALAGETLPVLPSDTYDVAHTALSAAQAAYEARFGHVFVISLDGVPAPELLDRALEALRSRLTHDPEEERTVVAEELRRLARERLISHLVGTGL